MTEGQWLDKWETIGPGTTRLKVPEGWLVKSHVDGFGDGSGAGVNMIFIKDILHFWQYADTWYRREEAE